MQGACYYSEVWLCRANIKFLQSKQLLKEMLKKSIKYFCIMKYCFPAQYCVVSSGKWRNNVDVAVKTLKPGQMSVEAFLEEARIMHKLRHRKLVQLMGVCTLQEPVYIITELMVHGALLDFLRGDAGKSVKLKEMVDIATQVGKNLRDLILFAHWKTSILQTQDIADVWENITGYLLGSNIHRFVKGFTSFGYNKLLVIANRYNTNIVLKLVNGKVLLLTRCQMYE
jgi:serine/threonine protein kinase